MCRSSKITVPYTTQNNVNLYEISRDMKRILQDPLFVSAFDHDVL